MIEILSNVFSPRSVQDLVLYGIAFIIILLSFSIPCIIKINQFKNKLWSIWRSFEIFLLVALLYFLFFYSIYPKIYQFDGKHIGILLPRFGGVNLSEHLGDKEFNEAMSLELTKVLTKYSEKYEIPGLDTTVQIQPISFLIENKEDALAIMKKYSANIILYGYITKREKLYTFHGYVEIKPFGFIMNVGDNSLFRVEFSYQIGQPEGVRLSFEDSTYNHLVSYSRQIINGALPLLVFHYYSYSSDISCKLIDIIPQIDTSIKNDIIAPYLLYIRAQGFNNNNQLKEALDYYTLSIEASRNYIPKDTNIQLLSIVSKIEIAFIKYEINNNIDSLAKDLEKVFMLDINDKIIIHLLSRFKKYSIEYKIHDYGVEIFLNDDSKEPP